MPTAGSFAARVRSHGSMDRLQEQLEPDGSDSRVPTALDQMHDITEELTTQLTGKLMSSDSKGGEQSPAQEGGFSSPTPEQQMLSSDVKSGVEASSNTGTGTGTQSPGHTDRTLGQYSKGGDESATRYDRKGIAFHLR